jgi:hypothetical protein
MYCAAAQRQNEDLNRHPPYNGKRREQARRVAAVATRAKKRCPKAVILVLALLAMPAKGEKRLPAAFVGDWCLALENIVPASDTFPYRHCKTNENIDLIMRADGYDTYGASCEVRRITLRADGAWSVSYHCEGSGQKWDSDDGLRLTRRGFSMRFAPKVVRRGEPERRYYLLHKPPQ